MHQDEVAAMSVGALVMLVLSLFIGGCIISTDRSIFKQAAIERGYARHNPISGDWEWIDNSKREADNEGD